MNAVLERLRQNTAFSILGRIGGDATYDPRRSHPSYWPFSILGRIGGDATGGGAAERHGEGPPFQYPRSDRRRCNDLALSDRVFICECFQYPRSDRRRCNI